MNHIFIRKLALTLASVSFSIMMALAMLCSAAYGETVSTRENSVKAQENEMQSDGTEYPISCTSLVIENLASYDGAFYEDGSGREVLNVAALMVRNDSNRVIPYAHITVETEDASYIFDATVLPPNSRVLIPEKNGRILSNSEIIDYFGWNTVKDKSSQIGVKVYDTKQWGICLYNISDNAMSDLTVFYRTYIEDGDFYMGGKAFQTVISKIDAGESVDIIPQYYASGYSRVVFMES